MKQEWMERELAHAAEYHQICQKTLTKDGHWSFSYGRIIQYIHTLPDSIRESDENGWLGWMIGYSIEKFEDM